MSYNLFSKKEQVEIIAELQKENASLKYKVLDLENIDKTASDDLTILQNSYNNMVLARDGFYNGWKRCEADLAALQNRPSIFDK
jgi:hypothetical protein